jgi:hypothetical protein
MSLKKGASGENYRHSVNLSQLMGSQEKLVRKDSATFRKSAPVSPPLNISAISAMSDSPSDMGKSRKYLYMYFFFLC